MTKQHSTSVKFNLKKLLIKWNIFCWK